MTMQLTFIGESVTITQFPQLFLSHLLVFSFLTSSQCRVVLWGGIIGALQCTDEKVSEEDKAVYMDSSVHREDRSNWVFSGKMKGKVVAGQSEVYRSTTSSVRMELASLRGFEMAIKH